MSPFTAKDLDKMVLEKLDRTPLKPESSLIEKLRQAAAKVRRPPQ